YYFHLKVDDRPGVLARVAEALAERDVSIARLLQHPNGIGAALHIVTHEAREGALKGALAAITAFDEVRTAPRPYPVVSERGVSELGWA
ncbi:MAG: ACT domain-containing protein, partial [Actinobacteria bacterium]|nr:ACT domain-containing protein [Actinomycetota bacterium]